MKKLTNNDVETLLCAMGYLPPRTEEEHLFFEEMYADYHVHIERHVDVEAIVSGACIIERVSDYEEEEIKPMPFAAEPNVRYSMAARNFDKLPKEIIEKMKKQHKPKDEDDK